jgi:prolyl 4-hydroxylase
MSGKSAKAKASQKPQTREPAPAPSPAPKPLPVSSRETQLGLNIAALAVLVLALVLATNERAQQWVQGLSARVSVTRSGGASQIAAQTDVKANAKAKAAAEAQLPKGANAEGKPLEVKLGTCKDRHEQCKVYLRQGECDKNPGWMIVNCPNSCNACHLLDPKVRCDRKNLNISTDPIYRPGDMQSMFESIVPDFGHRYGVTVLSTDPYIVTFDNFLTDQEADALISTVDGSWERSTDTGSVNEFGETGRVLSQGRTSSNAWCRASCENNPHVKNVLKKIQEVTRVPRQNYESFQVLRYELGQQYNPHHDASASQARLSCGPRILTFFLYLSDVEEGGETGFPQLNNGEGIKVRPKKGSALLWPSTTNDNPEAIVLRTLHQAHPVVRGRKFAANTWIHLYDFEHSNLWGCTGTFDTL